MTTDLLEWTAADSKALDAYARSIPGRPPLKRDPHLAELLATLPGAGGRIGIDIGQPCRECGTPMAPRTRRIEGHTPHGARGRCRPCHDRARHRIGGHRD